jgi:hypothetical protein
MVIGLSVGRKGRKSIHASAFVIVLQRQPGHVIHMPAVQSYDIDHQTDEKGEENQDRDYGEDTYVFKRSQDIFIHISKLGVSRRNLPLNTGSIILLLRL